MVIELGNNSILPSPSTIVYPANSRRQDVQVPDHLPLRAPPLLRVRSRLPPCDIPHNYFLSSNYIESTLNSNSTVFVEPSSPAAAVVDESKKRCMLLNQESARSFQMQKQKHLENIQEQVSRLRLVNQEISNRTTQLLYHGRPVHLENERLHSDNLKLRQKLSEVCHVLSLGEPLQQQGLIAWTCNDGNNVVALCPCTGD